MLLIAATLGAIMATSNVESTLPKKTILVFSHTKGFRHDSIPNGIACLKKIGEQQNWTVDATEDPAFFSGDNLQKYDVIVFLSTTGNILDESQQPVFEKYIRSGGGYVGIHAAADTEYDWPWYGQLVGGYFKSHPRIQKAMVNVEDRRHPATKHLKEKWERTDEWYDYRENPRSKVKVLASLDTKSYEGHTMGDDHPIMWFHEFDGGRAFYTGFGHTKESYDEPHFTKLIIGAVNWASGVRRK